MKKIVKKVNYVFLSTLILFIGFIIDKYSEHNPVDSAFADTPPVFTAAQIAAWEAAGGDTSGLGDSVDGGGSATDSSGPS